MGSWGVWGGWGKGGWVKKQIIFKIPEEVLALNMAFLVMIYKERAVWACIHDHYSL